MTDRIMVLRTADAYQTLLFTPDISDEFVQRVEHAWKNFQPEIFEDIQQAYDAAPTHHQVLVVYGDEANPMETHSSLMGPYASFGMQRVLPGEEAKGLQDITSRITLSMLEQRAGDSVLLHAAVLGDPATKQAIALIGSSGTGKTTATMTLGTKYAYLSDETTIINSDLSITPYPKPLSIIETRGEPKAQIPAAERGLQPVDPRDTSYTLSRLVLLKRDEQFSEPTLEPITIEGRLQELTDQSSALSKHPEGINSLLKVIEATGGVVQLSYAEISDTLPLIESLLAGEIPAVQEDVEMLLSPERLPRVFANGTVVVSRAQGTSAAWLGETFYLLHDQTLDVLSPFAAECWVQAEGEKSIDEHFKVMGSIFEGLPQDAYHNIMSQLAESGILQIYVVEDDLFMMDETLNEAADLRELIHESDEIVEEDFAD